MKEEDNPLITIYHDHEKKITETLLPESVWEDLNMDDFLLTVDYTSSRVGQQYLYHILHLDYPSEVEKHEELLGRLTKEKELRTKAMSHLDKLKHPDTYYIASLFAESIPEPSPNELLLMRICRFLPFLLTGLAFITHSPYLLLLLFVSVIINVVLHYRNKTKIYEYYYSVPQVVRLLNQAQKLAEEKSFAEIDKEIAQVLDELKELKKHLKTFKLSIGLESDIAIIAYYISELFNIFFLTEVYTVSKALILLKSKRLELKSVYRFVGLLDTLCSVSLLREKLPDYCLPGKSTGEGRLHAEAVYHPLIVDAVSNDIVLSGKSVLVTGSNMSGKTSFIRTIGISLISAKALNTCFAHRFEIPDGTRLASAIHSSDSLIEGKSYFLSEVEHVKQLLTLGRRRNYVFLLDEPFKGTNTAERIAIGKAVLSELSRNGNTVLISTHDLELGKLLETEYDLYHFSESVKDNVLSFDYKLKKGISTERNAIKILEICGFPKEVIQDANDCFQ